MSTQTSTKPIDRSNAIASFVLMLAERTSATPDALLEAMHASHKDHAFSFTIAHTPLEEFEAPAKAAFGDKLVTLDFARSQLHIDDVYLDAVDKAIRQLKNPHRQAPLPPPGGTQEKPLDTATRLALILATAAETPPPDLDDAMDFNSTTRITSIVLKRPALKAEVRKAVEAYLADTHEGRQKPEITFERNTVILNGPAANAIKWAAENLPPGVTAAPYSPPFDDLRKLLTKDPGKAAFFDFVSNVDSRAVESYPSDDAKGGGPTPGGFVVVAGAGINPPAKKDEDGPEFETAQDNARPRITGVAPHKTLPRIYIETAKKIDTVVRAIDNAQAGPQVHRVQMLAREMENLHSDLMMAREDITSAQMIKTEGDQAKQDYAKRDFPIPPAVMEWLDKTIDALDERHVQAEIAARRNLSGPRL